MIVLGIPERDFWRLWPRRLDAYARAFEAKQELAAARHAELLAAIYNWGGPRGKGFKPKGASEFMTKKAEARQYLSSAEAQNVMMAAVQMGHVKLKKGGQHGDDRR